MYEVERVHPMWLRRLPPGSIAMDIGGTLAKVIQVEYVNIQEQQPLYFAGKEVASLDFLSEDGKLRVKFSFFRTKDIELVIEWLQGKRLMNPNMPVTGGGAFKFQEILAKRLGVRVCKFEEMASLMTGLNYVLNLRAEVCRYNLRTCQKEGPLYPFILVNIGSGVSVLKSEGPGKFSRITGTSLGGGLVLGLARLLLGVSTFQEVVDLSLQGNNALDLVVSDLHGDAAGSHCLPGNTLASSFGKLYMDPNNTEQGELDSVRKEDIARSLIIMVSYNLGYLAYLIGTIHGIQRVFFAGKFISNHTVTMAAITEGVYFYNRYYNERQFSSERSKRKSLPLRSTSYRPQLDRKSGNNGFDRCVSIPAGNRSSLSNRVSSTDAARPNRQKQIDQTNCGYSSTRRVSTYKILPSSNGRKDIFAGQNRDSEKFEVLFLKHDGYLGSLGALLLHTKEDKKEFMLRET